MPQLRTYTSIAGLWIGCATEEKNILPKTETSFTGSTVEEFIQVIHKVQSWIHNTNIYRAKELLTNEIRGKQNWGTKKGHPELNLGLFNILVSFRLFDKYWRPPYTYLRPPDTYLQPPETYLQPPDTYLRPTDTYLRSPNTYLRPPDPYLQSPNTYLQPRDSYLQPTDTYLRPPDSYLQPPDTYLRPPDTYLQPPDTYLQPPDTYLWQL